VILAGAYTSWLAFSSPDAMVVDDYYRQGKAINLDLRRVRAAAGLGVSFHGRYDAAAGVMQGALTTFGAPLAGKIRLHFIHPTRPDKDRQLEAQSDAHGRLNIDLPALEKTHWQISLESEQRLWRLSGAWHWPQQQTIDLQADPLSVQ